MLTKFTVVLVVTAVVAPALFCDVTVRTVEQEPLVTEEVPLSASRGVAFEEMLSAPPPPELVEEELFLLQAIKRPATASVANIRVNKCIGFILQCIIPPWEIKKHHFNPSPKRFPFQPFDAWG